jgi:hypothetical protein
VREEVPSPAAGQHQAKTTPYMYVIDREGILVSMGVIDDQPRNFGADPAKADNYVQAALASLMGSTDQDDRHPGPRMQHKVHELAFASRACSG